MLLPGQNMVVGEMARIVGRRRGRGDDCDGVHGGHGLARRGPRTLPVFAADGLDDTLEVSLDLEATVVHQLYLLDAGHPVFLGETFLNLGLDGAVPVGPDGVTGPPRQQLGDLIPLFVRVDVAFQDGRSSAIDQSWFFCT